MSVLNEVRNWLSTVRSQPARYSVRWDECGNTYAEQRGEDSETTRITWRQVTDVFAYKRDCFAYDQICLLVEASDIDRRIEVREDDEGYEGLIQQLPLRLDGAPTLDEWWNTVVLPPFETQWKRLYSRQR